MTRLVLINGAPGAGKSTLAGALAQDQQLALQLDVDAIKHSLGRWDEDATASGLHARRLSLALAGEHLSAGYDVMMGQYLARPEFILELGALAERHGAGFFEFVLEIDESALAERLRMRTRFPTRMEHEVHNRLVRPGDAGRLVAAVEALRPIRPDAIWIDARGSERSVLALLRASLDG